MIDFKILFSSNIASCVPLKDSAQMEITMKSVQVWFKTLFAVNILGLATHVYLTMQHYQLKLGLSTGPAICNINSTFNCDSIAASKFSAIFGIPVALLGLTAQLISLIFVIAIFFEIAENITKLKKVLLYFSAFIAAVSIGMGGISIFMLGTYCLFCMAAYLFSFIQLYAAVRIQDADTTIGADLEFPKWSVVMILASPIAAWMLNSITLSQTGYGKMGQIISDSLNEWRQNPQNQFSLEAGLTSGADAQNSKMVIVEFADFLCPHCKFASPTLNAFIQSHKDASLVYKSFPLDGNCNPGIPHKGNGVRCKLAASVFCADKIAKKGWQAHHYIFEHQEDFASVNDFEKPGTDIAEALQISPDELKQCISSDSTSDAISAMVKEGANAKIQGTPTIFVNGKELPRGSFLPVLNAVYSEIFIK